ncbi:hypothetical protein [Burkholderia gladioli]|uniref:hypothetical protein n=1 Tax=Burkholderia gladioli TaxID=28095 RepID=UPI001640F206|nr:hypothetical protein [Burkholderia gladioli]
METPERSAPLQECRGGAAGAGLAQGGDIGLRKSGIARIIDWDREKKRLLPGDIEQSND